MKILTIGSAMYDLFLEYTSPQTVKFTIDGQDVNYIILEEGHKIELSALLPFTGGGATNTAFSFTRLGFTTATCAKIGHDEYGAFIVAALEETNINTSYITLSSDEKTGCSFIIPSPTGDKAILTYRGANLQLTTDDIPLADFGAFDQLYITSLSRSTSVLLPIMCNQAKKDGIPVAVNPGTSQLNENVHTLIESLNNIDILILNCFESSLLMAQFGYHKKKKKSVRNKKQVPSKDDGLKKLPDLLSAPITRGDIQFTLPDYFKEIQTRGPHIVVVTNGADGVYVSDGTTIYYHPSLPIEVISTVGAGDAFASTFVAQLLQKKSIENAIRAGIINSAAVLEHFGATTGLLDQQELNELVSEIDQNGIKKFPLTKL